MRLEYISGNLDQKISHNVALILN